VACGLWGFYVVPCWFAYDVTWSTRHKNQDRFGKRERTTTRGMRRDIVGMNDKVEKTKEILKEKEGKEENNIDNSEIRINEKVEKKVEKKAEKKKKRRVK
jgi:hypothetical protein